MSESKSVRFRKTLTGYRFVGSYEIAALLSTNLNTPATQSTANRHLFIVEIKEEMYTRAAGALATVGIDSIEIVHKLSFSPDIK
jgi:hypothetical protein